MVVNVIFPGLFQINWGNHTSLGTEDNESTDEKKKKNHRHNYFPQSFIHIVVNMKQLVPTSSHKLVSQKVWNKCGKIPCMIERKSALFRRVDVLRVAPSLPILVAENSVEVWVYWLTRYDIFIHYRQKKVHRSCM